MNPRIQIRKKRRNRRRERTRMIIRASNLLDAEFGHRERFNRLWGRP